MHVSEGPLAGNVDQGSFAFDSSSVSPGTHSVWISPSTASPSPQQLPIRVRCFGSDCHVGCSLTQPTNSWWLTGGGDPIYPFGYTTSSTDDIFRGTATRTRVPVPEAVTLDLWGFGMPAVAAVMFRRKRLA